MELAPSRANGRAMWAGSPGPVGQEQPEILPKGRIGRFYDLLTAVTTRPARCVRSPSEGTCGAWPHRTDIRAVGSKRCCWVPSGCLAMGLTSRRDPPKRSEGPGGQDPRCLSLIHISEP